MFWINHSHSTHSIWTQIAICTLHVVPLLMLTFLFRLASRPSAYPKLTYQHCLLRQRFASLTQQTDDCLKCLICYTDVATFSRRATRPSKRAQVLVQATSGSVSLLLAVELISAFSYPNEEWPCWSEDCY